MDSETARGASTLPPGQHSYEEILDGVRAGRLSFARVRAASGRAHFLIGMSAPQFSALRREARRRGVGLVLLGSRVSGPRLRQGELNPLLKAALPLSTTKRSASATYPASDGVLIEKLKIKELGADDPRTSDLTVFLAAPGRSDAERETIARGLEDRFRGLGCSFPIRVFWRFAGRVIDDEEDVLAMGSDYLRGRLPKESPATQVQIEKAFQELYALVNMPSRPFAVGDAVNGVLSAALLSASFALSLGLHPVIPAMGFLFGFCGRHLARFKTWITREPADTFGTNALALAADAAIGIALMGLVINPAAGFGIPWARIVEASVLHSASKGSIRLYLDKRFSRGTNERQRLGVLATITINFILGLATAWVYAGSRAAVAFQCSVSLVGFALVFANPLRQALARPSPRTRLAAG